MKKTLDFIIKSMNGMAYGLFSTLIIGTIIGTIASLFEEGFVYAVLNSLSILLKNLTGVGIGIGIAWSLKIDGFDAKEVSQVYVKDVFSLVVRPVKELKAFSKDLIKAKQTITVSHTLSNKAFAYYSTIDKDWYVENGVFEILVGSSSRDIKLKEKIQINLPEFTQHSVLK